MGSSPQQVLKRQLQTFKHQIEQLSRFVIRLCKFYEGAHPDLDKELQILRNHLAGQANFTMAEASMGKLTGLLLQDADGFKKHNLQSINLLEESVKELLKLEAVPDEIKNQANQFISTIQSDELGFLSLLPLFEKTLTIYQQALENASEGYAIESKTSEDGLDVYVNEKLHTEISHELRELIDQLAASRKDDKQLKQVKEQLIKGIDHKELLKCCLVIIRAIIRDVVKERKHAEKFVAGLHSSLTKAHKNVARSIDDAKNQFEAKQQNINSLRDHLSSMEEVVIATDDLASLKQQASDQLKKMASTIEDRERSDQQEQQTLMNLLNDMKDQLTALEQETSEYKHRLMEQKYNSHHDPLTQIPNRTAYNERIEMEYRRWKRHGSELGLAVIDVDHFKNINDNYGHAGGDKTLQVLAQNINRCLRSTDFLARWGGEEFIVLFPQTSLTELEKPLETIRRQIERIPFKFKEQKVNITISIGASTFVDGDTIETVFERADKGLYEAKNSGRNRIVVKQG